MIGRTFCVFFSAASINDAARRPYAILKDVPSQAMCLELERFASQARTEMLALSGMKFFHMTRHLILSVAGTLFTYDLAMLELVIESEAINTDFAHNFQMSVLYIQLHAHVVACPGLNIIGICG
jgi:gustatory receptor